MQSQMLTIYASCRWTTGTGLLKRRWEVKEAARIAWAIGSSHNLLPQTTEFLTQVIMNFKYETTSH